MKRIFFLLVICSAVIFSGDVTAEVNIPHTFADGNPALADDVNENFNVLKFAVENIEPVAFTITYDQPFSANGTIGNRNVILFQESDDADPDTIYYSAWIYFTNTVDYTISQNGSPTSYPYIALYLTVVVNLGNISHIYTYTEGLSAPYSNAYTSFIESATRDTVDPSIKTIDEDTKKMDRKCFNTGFQSVAKHCVEIYKFSASGELIYMRDASRINSLLGEAVTINGMTFSDVSIQYRMNGDQVRLFAKDIGMIYRYSSHYDQQIIYYRIDGSHQGSLIGTPFDAGGDLNGMFF